MTNVKSIIFNNIIGLTKRIEYKKSTMAIPVSHDEMASRCQRDYVSSLTRLRLVIITLLALMTFGATNALAQTTDYSGIYYIASDYQTPNTTTRNYNPTTLTDNFYMCPTENWISFNTSGATKDTWTTGDDKPFLTTYKVRSHAGDPTPYDITKAKWTIEYSTTDNGTDYYYIKHSSGKYLVLNKQIDGVSGTNNHLRIRVHLENLTQSDLENEATRDNALFAISRDGRSYIIDPKTQPTFYLTVNKGNGDYLQGENRNSGGTIGSGASTKGLAGTIGIYQGNTDDTRYLYLEDVITRPTIAFNSSDLIEITAAQEGSVTIRYTTDGTTPSRTNGTVYSGAFDPADNVTIIRAIAYGDDWESNIATFAPTVLCGTTHKRLIQSQNNNWTTGDHQGFHFYMVPGDEDNNKVLRVNTTSLFRSSMEWYFKSAGVEDGVQYYYIVNNANRKYLRCDAKNNVYLDTYSDANDNKFKFKIVESPTTGTYNIYPHGLNILINKNTDNANNGVINTVDYNANSSNSGNTRWKFVSKSALDDQAVPFTVSDGSSRTHYKLRSSGDEFYVKAPAAASANATMVAAASADEDTYWYLEQAAAATDADWLTYYYIRNAKTGDYLYYANGNPSNNNAAFKTSTNFGEAERYQFAWARSTTEDYYFIVPKMLRDQTLNNFSTLNRSNTTLNVAKVRATGTSAWTFVPIPFCLDPVITQAVDGTRTVTMTCSTPGVDIYYTTDGTNPTFPIGETTTQKYEYDEEHPFIPDVAVDQIKAIAVCQNDPDAQSAVVTFTLPKYTYHIVNSSNELAVSKADVRQAAGTPLRNGNTDANDDGITDGYNDIPEDLRSSYISDETITFYTMEGAFDASLLDAEHRITTTPATSANIYITYTTTKLGSKFLSLTNSAPFNIKDTGKCQYVENDELKTDDATAEYKSDRQYLWYFLGADPYKVTVQNVGTSKWLTYSESTMSVGESFQTYILKGTANHAEQENTKFENVTLVDASGNTFTIGVNTVVLPIRFTLIDKQNNVIQSEIEYDGSLSLPSAWRSPLATYHYWNANAFVQTNGTPNVPYVFVDEDENGTPDASEITSVTQVASDNIIYVTYDVSDDIDLDGRDLLNNRGGAAGTTYMLQFANGVPFKQEDGSDGVMGETRKAVYPYSNGDGTLYVYGNERWNAQLESGASTRTRWLWYLEPSTSKLDPYHVKISSYQTQTNYKVSDTETRNFHSYLRTYKPDGYTEVVTGATNDNPKTTGGAEDADADNSLATEYMILGTSLSSLKLQTVEKIDGSRRIVNSFEQYWKNNPTVQGKLTTTSKVTTVGRDVVLNSTQKSEVEALGWHVYKAWANSAPWVHNHDEITTGGAPTTSKKFLEEEHVFQTISMGDGSFQLVPTEIKPMLILLDQHGWEIVRLPLPSGPTDPKRAEIYANIHKYSSPMVARYHFWKTGSKVPGYHKFNVSDYATVSATDLTEYTADELGRADITNPLTPPNLPNYESQALVSGKERDWYVTYDVEAEYANAYAGADTEDDTSPSQYLIKQGGNFAQLSGTSLSSTSTEPDLENVPENMQWYLRPNFNIDEEMGYQYEGQNEEKTKNETEAEYVAAGKNGFDPYNVQIQSVSNTNRYFTANTTGSAVAASWTGTTNNWPGTSKSIELQNKETRQEVTGLDQANMNITNATFMVIDDGAGNMRLMPRFDHTKVMQSFTTLAAPAEQTASVNENQIFTLKLVPQTVHRSSEIKAMGGKYILASDFTASGSIGTRGAPFKGTIEGRINQSFSVSAPFIAFAEDAVIKNVIIESSSVSSGNSTAVVDETEVTALGAICNVAQGNTRIYNCGINGGSVSGSADYVGGIVGLLDGSARVINCYSYADISEGSYVGGIVGYNNYLSSTFNEANIRTMVMNCMFYGDITGGSNKAPIYNGFIISNKDATGLGNYNYFLAEKPYVQNDQINTYNCALMAETRFLQRFEFYRLLLNSHLELAGWYATGEYSKDQMMKWVLETADRTIENPKPYPVLKAPGKYPSIINYDADNAPETGERNTGKKLGSLSVTISTSKTDGGQTWPEGASVDPTSLSLPITDKDFERFNFNYGKVQLPYYNDVGTKNYTGNRVVTGWKITSISGGTAGSYTTGDDATTDAEGNITNTPYNFADRNCTDKDLYTKSGRVFNQGAYWDVPNGVTAITIEPYWGKAAYLADAYPDVVYNQSMDTKYDVPYVGGGEKYKNGSTYNIAGDNTQKVYTNIKDAKISLGLASGQTVYDNAVVLVGNAHNIGVSSDNVNELYTIMSADFDHDNEPDYSYMLRFNGRTECHPVRTDFVNIPGLGMAQKSTGGTGSYNFGILIPKGWFESTNTSLFRFTQFEYEHSSHPADAPLILQGGVMEQWVSYNQKGRSNKIPYIHVGGNVWFKEFHTGCHQDKNQTSGNNRFQPTKHSPISVTGGDFDEFYLTGLYVANAGLDNYADNAECYINGGRFGTVCGAAMEGIGKANGADNTGNIVWQIQNADIHEFYAGGLNAAKPVTGNLSTTITDSYVDIFCGGPKFGDMSDAKTVHTKATGCTFGTYFGAGYGGNSYSRYAPSNQNNVKNIDWNDWLNGQYKQEYKADYGGVSTQFTYQFLPMSDNTTNVARILIDFVKFSLATTRNVTSTLTGCTVTGNFYGGGSLGKVDGNVTSTLTDCNVKGSVFGAGFSASLPDVVVDAIGFEIVPLYYEATGTYRTGVKYKENDIYKPITYRWEKKTGDSWIDKTNHILYTNEDLNTLGAVTGEVTLNIDGTTNVVGSVFGGGESSSVTSTGSSTIVNVRGDSQIGGNVFGGGDRGAVAGKATVNIEE